MRLFGWDTWRGSFRGQPSPSDLETCADLEEEDMNLTPERQQILSQFRERVSSLLPPGQQHDHDLLQWLVARNFNLDKAESMLKNVSMKCIVYVYFTFTCISHLFSHS
ncbi:uncharacterized protein LOC119589959 [Penaeus monodon]|uniref:uncharacterized protein LOC119589959 n=1 Tax=Penaeus monodon TaxID=6687 RepID=UPI0018A744F0|nr:uncharacterized protein LOC119589959 [Penaeus monodon]